MSLVNNPVSHLTARKRSVISKPLKDLIGLRLLKGSILDYGCGKGFDSRSLRVRGHKCDSFDPHYQPNIDRTKRYDTILCTYVLNVIPSEHERQRVCRDIFTLLKPGGRAYISVRRDIDKEGFTKLGTWQGTVDVPCAELMFEKKGKYALFTFAKGRHE